MIVFDHFFIFQFFLAFLLKILVFCLLFIFSFFFACVSFHFFVIQGHTITFVFTARFMLCADTAAQNQSSVACNMPSTLAVSGGASTAVVGLYLVRTALQQNWKGAVEAVHTPSLRLNGLAAGSKDSSFRVRPSCTNRFCPLWNLQRSQKLRGCWWYIAMPYLLGLSWVTPAVVDNWHLILEAERALEP